MVIHFSVFDISVFFGNRYMYIIAVYMANMATVAFGFLRNLIFLGFCYVTTSAKLIIFCVVNNHLNLLDKIIV